MKISEFISKYECCPVCGKEVECTIHFNLLHTLNYTMVGIAGNFYQFERIPEAGFGIKSANSRGRVGTGTYFRGHRGEPCGECDAMPYFFQMRDHFSPPKNIWIRLLKTHGDISLSVECRYNDFLMHSTSANIFSENQDVNISSDGFEINWDKIIFNDYERDKTTIRILTNGSDRTKEIKLVPLDKWPLGDKIKLRDKVDKLLVLL